MQVDDGLKISEVLRFWSCPGSLALQILQSCAGPPGTGKTATGAQILRQWLKDSDEEGQEGNGLGPAPSARRH